MKIAVLSVAIISLLVLNLPTVSKVQATYRDSCYENFTYEKTSDYDDHRVHIEYEEDEQWSNNYKHRVSITAANGYKVIEVWLEVDGVNVQGWDLHFDGELDNYNPNPGGRIDEVKVIVKKDCPESTPEPTVEPSPKPSPEVTPEPTATPSAELKTSSQGPSHIEVDNTMDTNECEGAPTKKPILTQLGSLKQGCISWRVQQTDPYDEAVFSYGYEAGNYPYGVPSLGNQSDFTFETCELESGRHVWGQVDTKKNYCSSLSDHVDPVVL